DPTAVLGVSVSTTGEARAAEVAGADYLGGPGGAPPTKPGGEPRGLVGRRTIAREISLPVVGVGGIHAGNAADVLEAGAAGSGVVAAVGGGRGRGGATE